VLVFCIYFPECTKLSYFSQSEAKHILPSDTLCSLVYSCILFHEAFSWKEYILPTLGVSINGSISDLSFNETDDVNGSDDVLYHNATRMMLRPLDLNVLLIIVSISTGTIETQYL